MLKQGRANRLLVCSVDVDAITPAGHKSIEHATAIKVSPQVPLQIENADVDQHVCSLQTSQLLDGRKWQVLQIVGIEERKVQACRIQRIDHPINGRLSSFIVEAGRTAQICNSLAKRVY